MGASCTFVPPKKVNANQKLQVQCAHGNISEYPTAQLEISITGITFKIRAGVSPTLPRQVLLGCDVWNLVGLAVREANPFSVLTRLQKRKQERENATVLAREISGEAKPKALGEIDGTVNRTVPQKELNAIEFCDFEDGLFQERTKKRKTNKDKRTARKDWWKRAHIEDDAASSSGASRQGSLESEQLGDPERLQQDVGELPQAMNKSSTSESEAGEVAVINMSPDKLRELQQTDLTLDNVYKLAETETVTRNRNVRFVVWEKLLYR